MRWNLGVKAHVGHDLASGNFLWDAVGCVDTTQHVIYVDYRFDVLSTFIHECLHILLGRRREPMTDEEEEKEVQRLEQLIMRYMTPRQAKRLHTEMALMLHVSPDNIDPDDLDD